MTDFTTRVELHGADATDYAKLHEAMARQGFSRTVRGNDGKTYQLPTAEYLYSGETTSDAVLQRASLAAGTVKSGSWILVTRSAGITFRLQEVSTGLRFG